MRSALDRLYGRLVSLVAIGRITATTALEGRGLRQAQLRIDDAEARDATPLLAQYGLATRPLAGAQAVVLFLTGDRSRGLVIATNDARYQIEMKEGEVALHDNLGQRVHLTRTGIVIDGAGRTVRIQHAPEVVADTPRLTVTGDVVAGGVSLRQHVHQGVQPGAGQSGAPVA